MKRDYDEEALNIIKKQNQFNGFFYTVFNKYWQTLIFFVIIVVLIVGLQYVQKRLQFSESKMIINWFGILIIVNVIITYTTIIIYQQVKDQSGLPGAPGVQGPTGEQGYSDYCATCNKEVQTFKQKPEEAPIKQPILPDKIIVEHKPKKQKNKSQPQ
jgi:hypothetical protein